MSKEHKKGFTIIEVVIALSILTMVLTGVITIVVSALNLMMITRDSTEATAFTQEILTQSIKAAQSSGCDGGRPRGLTLTARIGHNTYTPTATCEIGTMSASSPIQFSSNDTGDYVRITAKATWTLRGEPYSYQIVQIVKKES